MEICAATRCNTASHCYVCHVLQCVAVCCSVLRRVAACCSVLQHVLQCCSVLQCAVECFTHCSIIIDEIECLFHR